MRDGVKSVHRYFDGLASEWSGRYTRRRDYRERHDVFAAAIAKALASANVGSVLEIGCGAHSMFNPDGREGLEYYATDISHEMLKKNSVRAYFFQADFFRLPLRRSFDMVILSSVVEWLDEPLLVPMIVSKLVKPGGILLVSYPNNQSLVRVLERTVVRGIKQLLRKRHYTDLQVPARYCDLADEFERQDFVLKDVVFFGKKTIFDSRYSSSLRLDVYDKK